MEAPVGTGVSCKKASRLDHAKDKVVAGVEFSPQASTALGHIIASIGNLHGWVTDIAQPLPKK
jgi:hypothetical protein